jgi:uncharacterized protein (TIGR00290 family)
MRHEPGNIFKSDNRSMTEIDPVRRKVLVSWSSGKDCAWALQRLRLDRQVEVEGLFAVVDPKQERVPMHTTRRTLLELQAAALGLPLEILELPQPYSEEKWGKLMRNFLASAVVRGIAFMAFGDLFLTEIRANRETQMAGSGIGPLFPLWNLPTARLAREMLAGGLEAWITSVDLRKLPADLAGQKWTAELLDDLPDGIDPCGENGEIHTVVVNGPMFRQPVSVRPGQTWVRNGFAYADLLPMP